MSARSYDQYCGLAYALDVVGERWTPLVVRELTLGPKRFTDLLDGLPGIGRTLLATRLKQLAEQGIVQRATLPPPAAATVYELTPRGERLSDALLPLQAWGRELLDEEPRPDDRLQLGWYLIHFRRGLRPDLAHGVDESYELHFPDEVWHLRVDDGRLDLRPGPAQAPAVVVTLDLETFATMGLGRISPADAAASGGFKVEGDPEAVARAYAICGVADLQAAADAARAVPAA